MDDSDILARIHRLVAEEDGLREQPSHSLEEDERTRMRRLEEELDQCWDLLRQRRARRGAGQDPEQASVRPVDVVEHYKP